MSHKTCCVDVGGQQFLLEMEYIQKVLPPTPITPIPLTPKFVSGLINVRSEVVVVIHLGNLLHIRAKKNNHILLVQHRSEKIGILIDEIRSFESFATPLLSLAANEFPQEVLRYAKGVAGEGRLPVIDIEKIELIHSD